MGADEVTKETDTFCDRLREQFISVGRKVKLWEAWRIIQGAIANTVLLIEREIGKSLSGPEKKAQAMASVEKVVKLVCNIIDLPVVPEWVEAYIDTYLQRFLMEVASGSIDAIVKTFHDTGVFPPKKEEE